MDRKINTIFADLNSGGVTAWCHNVKTDTVTMTIEEAVKNLSERGHSGGGSGGNNNPPPSGGGPTPPSGDGSNTLRWMFEFALTLHSPDAIITKNGQLIPIPDGFIGPFPTREPGMAFRGSGHPIPKELKNNQDSKGFNIRVNSIRIMDANWNQPDRVVYENRLKQVVDPKTGQTSQDGGHFYLDK